MSATQTQRVASQAQRSQNLRKRSKDGESSTIETYHKVSRWYPSISNTPEEPVVYTVDGGIPGQAGIKSRSEHRVDSRVGAGSSTNGGPEAGKTQQQPSKE